MSAELLRAAAAKMRERAEVWEYHSSPWHIEPGPAGWSEVRSAGIIRPDGEEVAHDTYVFQMDTSSTAEHIASWHPAVALAVADWLDNTAFALSKGYASQQEVTDSLAVARAYLGEES